MGISEKDIKLLWMRSGGLCSLCKVSIAHDSKHSTSITPLGEQAHIVGEKESAARGKSILNEKERNSYANLILLCPTCHTKIDKDVVDYPVELLHVRKIEHELYVKQKLSANDDPKAIAGDLVYSALIDAAVEGCRLKEWDEWIYDSMGPYFRWSLVSVKSAATFRRKVVRTVWPKQKDELERSIITLSLFMSHAQHMFYQNSRSTVDGWLEPDRFYKVGDFTQKEYDRRSLIYSEWEEVCDEAMFGVAKAANWFCDMVRSHINPLFFANEGKFILSWSLLMSGTAINIPEFTDYEKSTYPDGLALREIDVRGRIANR